jgi:hypothetical protein
VLCLDRICHMSTIFTSLPSYFDNGWRPPLPRVDNICVRILTRAAASSWQKLLLSAAHHWAQCLEVVRRNITGG